MNSADDVKGQWHSLPGTPSGDRLEGWCKATREVAKVIFLLPWRSEFRHAGGPPGSSTKEVEMRPVSIVRVGLASSIFAVAMLVVPFGAAFGGLAGASTVKLSAPTCSTVTPKMIGQYLKLTVSVAKRSTAGGGNDFLCEYGDKTSSLAVVIEYNSASTPANFTTVEDGFNTHDEPTTGAGKTFGSLANEGFWASFGSGVYAEHSVVVRQQKLEVDLASSASVSDLVALMKKVLVLV
jgi:hypothetical protein